MDEKGLLQRFMRGDPPKAGLEQIIRLYGDGLFGYLMKMSGDRKTAEDYFSGDVQPGLRN